MRKPVPANMCVCPLQLPRSAQRILMSATSSAAVEELSRLVLHNPVTLNLLLAGTAGQDGSTGAPTRDGASLASGSGLAVEIEHFYIPVCESLHMGKNTACKRTFARPLKHQASVQTDLRLVYLHMLPGWQGNLQAGMG